MNRELLRQALNTLYLLGIHDDLCDVIRAELAKPQAEPDSTYSPEPEQYVAVCKAVNNNYTLQSLLYDLNLLPEQTQHDPLRWGYTVTTVAHFFTAAPSAVPVPLSDADIEEIRFNLRHSKKWTHGFDVAFARVIERAHGIGEAKP